MTRQEYKEMVSVWVKLQMALGIFRSPEEDFPKGKDQLLERKIEEAYAIVDRIVAKGKE